MSIIYECRHCGFVIGNLQQQFISTSMLGLHTLTTSEKRHMLEHKPNGDIHVKVICENCEDTLKQHPNYYELDYFIQ